MKNSFIQDVLKNRKIKLQIFLLLVLILLTGFLLKYSPPKYEKIVYKGFGWYGYLADDEVNEKSIQKIKQLGGNSININVYYEYDPENKSFILLSNLTKIEEKIELVHDNELKVFLSPFVNLVGGHYTGGEITESEKWLSGAKNISIELAKFAQKNDVEIYAVWNELGLSIDKLPSSVNLTNEWLQKTKEGIKNVYNGTLTTKEGVQSNFYESYNFTGYDCIGVTFYPYTTSFANDPYTNITYAGVENLEEYEKVVKKEFDTLKKLKKKTNFNCAILGEIGIDVVGGKFLVNDEESNRIRAKAYEIIFKNMKNQIDGFFFSRFEIGNGGSEELDNTFVKYFNSSN